MRTSKNTSSRRRFLAAMITAGAVLLGTAGAVSAAPNNTPNAPDNLRVISGRYRLVAVWDAPVDNGNPYVGYRVTATNGTDTKTCTTSNVNITRCSINGLVPQTQYSVVVQARAAAGDSQASSVVNVMSWWSPQAPQGGTDFSGKDLGSLDLTWTNLTGANFTGTNFNGSNMRGAILKNSTVTNATFGNAELAEVRSGGITGSFATARQYYQIVNGFLIGPSVNLWNEDLSGLNLAGANLWGAQLSAANFTGANLDNANLAFGLTQGTNFTNAVLSRVNMNGTVATGANFTGTSLATAKIGSQIRTGSLVGSPALPAAFRLVNGHIAGPNVSLWRADLTGANLSGLNLTNTRAGEANFAGANFSNTNLTGMRFADAILSGATGSGITGSPSILPGGWRITAGSLING